MGATIARLNELRTQAELHAHEASLRVTLSSELRRGVDTAIVLRRLEVELDELFDVAARVEEVGTTHTATLASTPTDEMLVASPPLVLRLRRAAP